MSPLAAQLFVMRLPPMDRSSLRVVEDSLDIKLHQLGDSRIFVLGQRALFTEADRLVVLRVTRTAHGIFSVDIIDTSPDTAPPKGFHEAMAQVVKLHQTLASEIDGPVPNEDSLVEPDVSAVTSKSGTDTRPDVKLWLLGTAGGPLPSVTRSGIAQAVVVAGRVHLIDCGTGVIRQLRDKKLLEHLYKVYLTHMHSTHICDYFNLFLLGWPILQWNDPVDVFGPGPAGGLKSLPPDHPDATPFQVVNPGDPTPGLIASTGLQFAANAYDINIRIRDSGRRNLRELIVPHEIEVPAFLGARGPDKVAPSMEPIRIFEDKDVCVTAVLVQHGPVFPAFAFRFETERGSIVISGDTVPCENLTRLAKGADILVHEVFDGSAEPEWRLGESSKYEDTERMERDHLVKSHTAIGEIAKVAGAAGVQRLVLTHFVPLQDEFEDEEWLKQIGPPDFDGEVIVGEDLAEYRL